MNIICECRHSKDNHGIQSGCAQCQCVKSQNSVMVDALTVRVAELEAALDKSDPWILDGDYFKCIHCNYQYDAAKNSDNPKDYHSLDCVWASALKVTK